MITWPWSKIEKVVPTESRRPTIEDVWFDKEKGQLAATDGFTLAIIPVESQDGDVTGHIPMAAIKKGRKESGRSRLHIDAYPAHVEVAFNGQERFDRPDLPFPDYEQIVPLYDPDDEEIARVTLDARRLMQLAEALCQEENRAKKSNTRAPSTFGVTLTFRKGQPGPILVRPVHDNGKVKGRYGVIMPMHKS